MRRLLLVAFAALAVVPAGRAWTWPVDGPVLRPFSLDDNPYSGGQHRGIDIGAPVGAAVRAPASGRVSFAGTVPVYGRTLTVQTADGLSVTLVHLGSTAVVKGAAIAEGDAVGTVGPSDEPEVASRTSISASGSRTIRRAISTRSGSCRGGTSRPCRSSCRSPRRPPQRRLPRRRRRRWRSRRSRSPPGSAGSRSRPGGGGDLGAACHAAHAGPRSARRRSTALHPRSRPSEHRGRAGPRPACRACRRETPRACVAPRLRRGAPPGRSRSQRGSATHVRRTAVGPAPRRRAMKKPEARARSSTALATRVHDSLPARSVDTLGASRRAGPRAAPRPFPRLAGASPRLLSLLLALAALASAAARSRGSPGGPCRGPHLH